MFVCSKVRYPDPGGPFDVSTCAFALAAPFSAISETDLSLTNDRPFARPLGVYGQYNDRATSESRPELLTLRPIPQHLTIDN
jgi:hypothetical protein